MLYCKQMIRVVLLGAIILLAQKASAAELTARDIAQAYGLDAFKDIAEIRYTFQAILGEKRIVRSWAWEPEEDRVTFRTNTSGQTHTYVRHELNAKSSEEVLQIDKWFINDQYWLLFPCHLVWDDGILIENRGRTQSYIHKEETEHFVITYPPEGGYTPGDVYELFVGSEGFIHEWIYRRAGGQEVTRVTTWEDHRQIGRLVISTMHRSTDETFRLWFSSVAVRMRETGRWIHAERATKITEQ